MMNIQIQSLPETPSPFIDGTNIQYAWDSTSLGWAKTCPRLYYYNMIEGYRPKGEAIHLRFGIEYHQALQTYDQLRANDVDHEEALVEVVLQTLIRNVDYPAIEEDAKPSEKAKTKDNLLRTIIWYLDEFAEDPAKTVIKKNGDPAVEQSFRFELDYGPVITEDYNPITGILGNAHHYVLCGHLDRLVTYNDEIFVMDRKTTYSTPGSYYFDRYEPDNQMSLYTLAGQITLTSPVKGVIIDVAQVAVGFSRFVRGFTYRTKDQLNEWRHDLRDVLDRYEQYALKDYWPQNDTACDKYGGCRFRGVCSRAPSVRQAFLDSDFRREKWNPLAIR